MFLTRTELLGKLLPAARWINFLASPGFSSANALLAVRSSAHKISSLKRNDTRIA
jgi:hypothetical protein